jgi:ribose transport system substrate-binding protein
MDRKAKLFAGLAAVVMTASLAGSVAAQSPAAPAAGKWVIGASNTLQGNGWREEMICSIKAQAKASGEVSKLIVAHRTTDAAGQLEDLRNLISSGVNAIVVNPVSPDAVNTALQEAIDKGITVVAVDMGVSLPAAYLVSNDQTQYGYLGAKWLFDKLGGKGNVVYMRGIAGAQADTDRDAGFKKALAEYPNIKIISETFTGWDQATGAQQINDVFASGQQIDGVWTSGIDSVIVDAFKTAGKPYVPIVGADNSGFVKQLISEAPNGLVGAAVTNTATVGGAGVTVALKVLDGQKPDQTKILLTPQLWDNTAPDGQAALKAAVDPSVASMDQYWPLTTQVPGYTTYQTSDLLACKGPGE